MIRDFALRKDPRQHVPAHAQHLSRCWQHLTASLGCWHCIHRDYGWAVGDAVNGQHDELRPTRPSTLLHHCLKLGMQTIVLVMHMRCGTGVRMRSDLRHPVGGDAWVHAVLPPIWPCIPDSRWGVLVSGMHCVVWGMGHLRDCPAEWMIVRPPGGLAVGCQFTVRDNIGALTLAWLSSTRGARAIYGVATLRA